MARRRSQLVQRTAAQVQSIPAPWGGWNARDSIADMEPTDAVTMVNMFPTVGNVVLRGGYVEWATGLPGQVQTLMTYNGAETTEMFAVDETALAIYDVTTQGAVGAAVRTGLSNAVWEYVNIATAGGNFLMAANGADSVLRYNGTTWDNPAITGVTSSSLINIELFKNRLWFIEKDTLKAWYLPVSSVAGAASMFNLSSVARKGGYLVDIATWTIDAGYGVDDNLAFITSQGEVIVYRGTDPDSAATWTLMGVWQIGAPIGRRCFQKFGGDLLVLTFDGLMPLAAAVQSSRLDPRVALSDKIQGAISAATAAYSSASVGWEIFYYPRSNAIWINVPVSLGRQEQYVMNTITKSWCSFTGWAANCWTLTNDLPYFGGDGVVCKAWDQGFSDNDSNIETSVIQAFNYMGQRGVEKYFTRARPSIFSNGQPAILIGLNIDYQLSNTFSPLSFSPITSAAWDDAQWDVGLWGDSLTVRNQWQGVTGVGYCAGIVFKSASQGLEVQWAATDVVFQGGWAGI